MSRHADAVKRCRWVVVFSQYTDVSPAASAGPPRELRWLLERVAAAAIRGWYNMHRLTGCLRICDSGWGAALHGRKADNADALGEDEDHGKDCHLRAGFSHTEAQTRSEGKARAVFSCVIVAFIGPDASWAVSTWEHEEDHMRQAAQLASACRRAPCCIRMRNC